MKINKESFYIYNKNIFENGNFKKNIEFNLARLNIDNIQLYHNFNINNMMCIDNRNYQLNTNKKRVIFIGDSFTSGLDCSYSWFEILKNKMNKNIDIFNFSC